MQPQKLLLNFGDSQKLECVFEYQRELILGNGTFRQCMILLESAESKLCNQIDKMTSKEIKLNSYQFQFKKLRKDKSQLCLTQLSNYSLDKTSKLTIGCFGVPTTDIDLVEGS